jgi:hypothetical protein
MRTFTPWVGSQYELGIGGVKVLILGEAHYGAPGEEAADFTRAIVMKLGQTERFRFFTVTQKLVSGEEGYVTNSQRAEFWERVAFCNFIQKFPGESPRIRPTPEMWRDAVEPFIATLEELRPDMVLVLGKELHGMLPVASDKVSYCYIQHPSSYRFDSKHWRGVIKAALDMARQNAGLVVSRTL